MKNSEGFKKNCFDAVKMVLIALIISLIGVLVLALIIRYASVDDKIITPVIYAVKVISVLLGCVFGFKQAENGILKGAVGGLVYVLLAILIFASLSAFKDVNVSWIDLVFIPLAGAISGVITVNLKARRT